MAVLDHNYDHNGKNEGEQRVSQTNFCIEKRTTKALNITDFRVFNHPCYCYEPVGRGFESPAALGLTLASLTESVSISPSSNSAPT